MSISIGLLGMYADYAEFELRIKDEFKKSGYFWLPANPEKKVPGTLVIAEGGRIRLELVGLFEESIKETYNLFSGNDYLKRILGHVEKDSLVTLENCSYTNRNISFSGGISKSTIRADMAMVGTAYEGEDILINTFRFSVEGIDEWVGITGIEVKHQTEKKTASVQYRQPEDLSLNLDNGMKLLVTFYWTPPPTFPNLTDAKITQKTYFKLVSEQECSLSDFISSAYKITTFLSFAMDQPVCIDSAYVTSKTTCKDIGKGDNIPPISLYYQSLPYTETVSKVDRHKMLFGLEQIQEDAESIFNKWFGAYEELSPALGLYFATRTGAYQLLDGKFLALAQGLEVYHSRTSNIKRMKLRERVEELIEP